MQTEIKTLSFFIDFPFFTKDQVKYQLPTISLSTDKNNLYSEDKGLFIAGDNFNTNKIHSGNYHQRGKDFEREVPLDRAKCMRVYIDKKYYSEKDKGSYIEECKEQCLKI